MEITELANRTVWLCQQPITYKEGKALSLPKGFSITGIGESAHDAAFFPRSPDATEDSPLETMKVGKYTFSKVAKPGKPESGFKDVLVLPVYKYHKVLFNAGRSIEILTMEDGKDYVPNVYSIKGIFAKKTPKERVLPEGWTIRTITLFHGPVEINKEQVQ